MAAANRNYPLLLTALILLVLPASCLNNSRGSWSSQTIQSSVVSRSIDYVVTDSNLILVYDDISPGTNLAFTAINSASLGSVWNTVPYISGTLNSPAVACNDDYLWISSIGGNQHTIVSVDIQAVPDSDKSEFGSRNITRTGESSSCLHNDIEWHSGLLYACNWNIASGKLQMVQCKANAQGLIENIEHFIVDTRTADYYGHAVSIKSSSNCLYVLYDKPYSEFSEDFENSILFLAQLKGNDIAVLANISTCSVPTSGGVVSLSELYVFGKTIALLMCMKSGDIIYQWALLEDDINNLSWNSVVLERNVEQWIKLNIGQVNGLPAIVYNKSNTDPTKGSVIFAQARTEQVKSRDDWNYETIIPEIPLGRFWNPVIIEINEVPAVIYSESNRATYSRDLKMLQRR